MTTLGQIRAKVRSELGDGTVPYAWSDGQLNEWLNQGLGDLAVYVPPERSFLQSSVAGTKDYALPLAAQLVVEVRLGGRAIDPARWRVAFNGTVQTLKLLDDPGAGSSNLQVFYLGFYATLVSDSDVLDLEGVVEPGLVSFVCWKACVWLGGQREKRGVLPGTAAAEYRALYIEHRNLHGRGVRSAYLTYQT
jgi:hypothetical protein